VALSTKTREDGRLSVDVRDDGRGIDFAALRRAAGAGDEVSDDELVERILSGGLSSAEEANEIAGRGVGVSAVKQACEALGGRMRVDTEAGKGTCFHFSFPPPSMA
jgi:chemotaxis protein histidine kinase CheA